MRILAAALALLVGGYQFLLYPAAQKELQNSENMVKRRLNRIAGRTRTTLQTDANPRALAHRNEKLDKELEKITPILDKLNAGFAPVEAGAEQQRLLLEISTLARQTGVELTSIGRGEAPKPGLSSSRPEHAGSVVDRRLGRPLLNISAHSDYWQLLEFLDGMKGLPYNVSVVRLAIRTRQAWVAEGGKGKQDKTIPPGALTLSLILAI